MNINTNHNDSLIAGTGVIGTIATWTLQGGLSVLATLCTIIVVGPKAWEQIVAWYVKYVKREGPQ